MDELLQLALQKAEQAEVYISKVTETPVQFETNRLKHIQTKQSNSVALRIIRNGRIGYATSTRMDDTNDLVESAVATAEFGQKAEFNFPSFNKFKKISTFDPAVGEISLDQMTALGDEMIRAITSYQHDVICEASINKIMAETTIVNSAGGKASYKESAFGIGVEGQVVHGTDMLFVGEHDGSCHPILDTKKIIRTTIKQLKLARKQATVETKRTPVIFTPEGTTSALIAPLMSAFNGKTVLEGASPIGTKLGEMV
ncbi:MAG TPA: DNA gyrase modulator, partial [Dehalococcoidales bacterium]|nr:DNA gyrase modulator [Dehalococcoidales bacterium]